MPRLGIYALIPLTCGSLILAGWTGLAAPNAAPVELPKPSAGNEIKPGLVGSYAVLGTDVEGQPYAVPGVVEVSLAPSGALEFNWDGGRSFGVGQVIGRTVAISSLSRGRTTILIMDINADGSLSGSWLRRTERGYRGTETWKRI